MKFNLFLDCPVIKKELTKIKKTIIMIRLLNKTYNKIKKIVIMILIWMNQWIKKIGNIINNFKNKQNKNQQCQLWLILIILCVNFASLIRNKKKLMIYSEFANQMMLPKLLI
jgi:hypothetical protein